MPDSPVTVTASIQGEQNPSVWFATFSNGVEGVNTESVVVTGPNGIVTGAAFFVPGGGTGPSYIAEDGTRAPALSVVFVPGSDVEAVPVCGTCRSTVEGGTPLAQLPDGVYTMSLSGLTDRQGRTIPDITITFSMCFVATLSGSRVANNINLSFNNPVKLTALSVTNPLSVTTNLSGAVAPAFGVAASAFVATYVDATNGTFTVNVSWTNVDGGCPTSGSFTFLQAS